MSKMKKKHKYWIEIRREKYCWDWIIKCINGNVKGYGGNEYDRRSLCLNDAKALAVYTGLNIRENGKTIYWSK